MNHFKNVDYVKETRIMMLLNMLSNIFLMDTNGHFPIAVL